MIQSNCHKQAHNKKKTLPQTCKKILQEDARFSFRCNGYLLADLHTQIKTKILNIRYKILLNE